MLLDSITVGLITKETSLKKPGWPIDGLLCRPAGIMFKRCIGNILENHLIPNVCSCKL